jgi:hypothetical protein
MEEILYTAEQTICNEGELELKLYYVNKGFIEEYTTIGAEEKCVSYI